MKNKNIFKILFFLVFVISILVFMKWNSEFNKNNRYLNDKLLKSASDSSGTAGELFCKCQYKNDQKVENNYVQKVA